MQFPVAAGVIALVKNSHLNVVRFADIERLIAGTQTLADGEVEFARRAEGAEGSRTSIGIELEERAGWRQRRTRRHGTVEVDLSVPGHRSTATCR